LEKIKKELKTILELYSIEMNQVFAWNREVVVKTLIEHLGVLLFVPTMAAMRKIIADSYVL
jgi:hypothetical protein